MTGRELVKLLRQAGLDREVFLQSMGGQIQYDLDFVKAERWAAKETMDGKPKKVITLNFNL